MEVLAPMESAIPKWNLSMRLKPGNLSFHLYIKIQHLYQPERVSRPTREKQN